MPGQIFSTFLIFSFIGAMTPGPNNILALSSGSRYGFRGSARLLAGIWLGAACVMVLCGLVSFSLSNMLDDFIRVMKYLGCVYIVWLAWKVATSAPAGEEKGRTGIGFLGGFALQFANIKIFVYGLTSFSSFVLPYYDTFWAVMGFVALATVIGNSGPLVWALAGSAMQRFLTRHARTTNIVLGLALLGCAVSLVW